MSDQQPKVKPTSWNPVIPACIYAKLPELSGGAVKVAIVLCRYADRYGCCYPSVATVAKDGGLNESTVRRAIKKLEHHGLLTVHRGGGKGNSNHYQLQTLAPMPPFNGLNPSSDATLSTPNTGAGACQTLALVQGEGIQGTIHSNKRNEKKGTRPGRDVPPPFESFKAFCQDNGFGHIAQKAFGHYSEKEWVNSKGKPVKDWQATLRKVWFDAEKNPPPTQADIPLADREPTPEELREIERVETEIEQKENT